MRQRKFEIVINECKNAGSSVIMKIGNGIGEKACKCLEYKFDSQELTEDEISSAVNKLMYYLLPEISVENVEEVKPVAKLVRTPDGNFVSV